MPRGVRRIVNYDSELAEIDRKIAGHKEQIHQLEDRRKEIAEQQQRADFERMMSFLKQQGISVEDAISLLSPATTVTA